MSRLGFLFLLVAGLAFAQQAPPATVSIEGVAFDAVTDRPLASVQVQIGNLRRTTNAQGQFSFEAVLAARQTLIATKDNYMVARFEKRSAPVSNVALALSPGQPVSGLKLYLYPTGVVTGQVIDAKGMPVQYAEVMPLRVSYDQSGELVPVQTTNPQILSKSADALTAVVAMNLRADPAPGRIKGGRTNDRGEFRIFNLDPGQYVFYVRMPASPDVVYYPGVSEKRSAGRVTVEGGVEARLGTIPMPSANAVRVSFKINDQSGLNGSGPLRLVRARGEAEVQHVLRESVQLQPGSYDVEVISAGEAAAFSLASGRTAFEVRDRDLEVEVTVPRSGALTGSVQSAQPLPKLKVVLDSAEVLRGLSVGITSDAEGKFAMAGIPAGKFQVRVIEGIPAGKCVTAFQQDGNARNVLKDGLETTALSTSFQITLSDAQKHEGKVVDASGQGVAGALIVLIPDDRAQTHLYATAISDQLGSFEIFCARPGAYRAYAWRDMDGAAYRNADFLKAYNERGKSVIIQNGPLEQMNLSVLER